MIIPPINHKQRIRGIREGYRSGLEESIASQLSRQVGVSWTYESERIQYIPDPRHYLPDFIVQGNNKTIYIETKGRFLGKDRAKHALIKKQHPEIDLRFVFTNPKQKLYKGSKTTYGEWCDKHGFLYSKRSIPDIWIQELKE